MPVPFALSSRSIDTAIFHVSNALQVPVLVLALLALALVIFELGSYLIEVVGRRGRHFDALLQRTQQARDAILSGNRETAAAVTDPLARSPSMARTQHLIVQRAGTDGSDHLLNKALADFDLESQKRLGRTRMLVRFGPALGLMGTLIPLSPALTGLANGDTATLSHDLRVRVQRHRRRAAHRRRRIRAVVVARPDVQPGSVGPAVPRGGAQRSTDRGPGMISVTPHARSREDRAGDPLDGLVNLFDLGIVLSVAFLLAALTSLHLGGAITKHGLHAQRAQQIRIKPGQKLAPLPRRGGRAIGRGVQAGVVYRLANGELVYVQKAGRAGATSGR